MQSDSGMSRRQYLQLAGASALPAVVAGCIAYRPEEGSDGGEEDTAADTDNAAVDEWLTETDIGGDASNYDGTIIDGRDESTIQVDVGAGSAGTEFEPAAVAVSPGTTVEWVWTGDGGGHNVEAEPDGQLGESDYEFSSGDVVTGEGETYEYTFEDTGIALYHCVPHLSIGMKGAIVVG